MRIAFVLAALAVGTFCFAASPAQIPADVPQTHWARAAVAEVVSRQVMDAPGGRFDGARRVTRTELAITLVRFARSLEQGRWPKNPAANKPPKHATAWQNASVNRYELAAILTRVASYTVKGLPAYKGKTYGESEALPKAVPIPDTLKSSPAYDSLVYLAKNRMVWPGSTLLQPGSQPVTGDQVSVALTQMLAGLNDRLTDEPQNREDLGAPPAKKP